MSRYDTYDDFMADLDRGGLSDDPFGVDLHEALSEEDLALIGGGKKTTTSSKAKPAPRRKPVTPKRKTP